MKCSLHSGSLTVSVELPESAPVYGETTGQPQALDDALLHPMGMPTLSQCVVPGDRVVVAVDPMLPGVVRTTAVVCNHLLSSHDAVDVSVLLPALSTEAATTKLANCIRLATKEQAAVHVHQPGDVQQRRYLASSTGGQRIYLSQYLVDSDLVVTIGCAGDDAILGSRGTHSLLYPDFSDAETIRRRQALLYEPDNQDRRLFTREVIDEVGWLLGSTFSVMVIPAADGHPYQAFCGSSDQVQRACERAMLETWNVQLLSNHDLVVASVVTDSNCESWKHFGKAVHALSLAASEGSQVAIVCDLCDAEPGDARRLLSTTQTPEDLLKPLRLEPTPDAYETIQLIEAQQRVRLFVRSSLPDDDIEDLGMLAVSTDQELQRLISGARNPAVIHGANLATVCTAARTETT